MRSASRRTKTIGPTLMLRPIFRRVRIDRHPTYRVGHNVYSARRLLIPCIGAPSSRSPGSVVRRTCAGAGFRAALPVHPAPKRNDRLIGAKWGRPYRFCRRGWACRMERLCGNEGRFPTLRRVINRCAAQTCAGVLPIRSTFPRAQTVPCGAGSTFSDAGTELIWIYLGFGEP